jgi:hypothetical protein
MKKLLFFFSILCISLPAFGQIGGKTTLITDRAIIRDSFSLGDIEITEIDTSSDWSSADHQQFATRQAIKEYVDLTTGGGLPGCMVYVVTDTSAVSTP